VTIKSPEYTFDDFEYKWRLSFQKKSNGSNLGIYLRCEADEIYFPVFVNANIFVMNLEDDRKHEMDSELKFLYNLND
jgi:hypothetical protein